MFVFIRNYLLLFVFPLCILCNSLCHAQVGNIYTFAGNGTAGFSGDGGPATAAQLNQPSDVFKDAAGNIYIADNGNNRIRKVNTSGIISTVAGNGIAGYSGDGGSALGASLNAPNGVYVDGAGNIYIADEGNNVIRMVNTSGIISTIAGNGVAGYSGDGGLAINAELNIPTRVAVDISGNIYISEMGDSVIRKVNPLGIISTYAGHGSEPFTVDGVPATSLSLCTMRYVSVDDTGNVYFTNQNCWHFLKIRTDGLVYNVAGYTEPSYSGDCGPSDMADVELPWAICPDNLGNVYVCPRANLRVRRVNTFNVITTVAGDGIAGYSGDGGLATSAEVSSTIYGIYADNTGNIYFADMGNNVIRNFTVLPYIDMLNICTGESYSPFNAIGGTWYSSNSAAATVNSSGIVTALAPGNTLIYNNSYCDFMYYVNVYTPTVLSGDSLCAGTTITLTDSVSGTGTWSNPINIGITIATVTATGVVSGISQGTSIITYTKTNSVCPEVVPITVNTIPYINMDPADSVLCLGNVLTFSSGNTPALWSTGTYATSINVTDSGTYWGTASNECGTTTDTLHVALVFCDLFFPTAFTPNNDGLNDIASPMGSLTFYDNYSLSIFNRYGQLVFYTKDVNSGWDGKFNGVPQELGVYYYMMNYTLFGKQYIVKGDLTLIR